MQKLTFARGNKTLEIGYGKPYRLQALSGITDAPVTVYSEKGFLQDGQTGIGQILEARTIAMTVSILGTGIADLYSRRRHLIEFFNPKLGSMDITYQNDSISKVVVGRVSQMPTIGSLEDGRAGKFQNATVSILCDDPHFLDLVETVSEMALVINTLEFPEDLPARGIEFGVIMGKQREIYNEGDVDCPVIVEFDGAITNPIVTNETTGEFIKVNAVITSGQKLIISTAYGKKRVTLVDVDGSESNAFGYIDLDSTFFQLIPGSNLISYDADSGADEVTLYIRYRNRFVGI